MRGERKAAKPEVILFMWLALHSHLQHLLIWSKNIIMKVKPQPPPFVYLLEQITFLWKFSMPYRFCSFWLERSNDPWGFYMHSLDFRVQWTSASAKTKTEKWRVSCWNKLFPNHHLTFSFWPLSIRWFGLKKKKKKEGWINFCWVFAFLCPRHA